MIIPNRLGSITPNNQPTGVLNTDFTKCDACCRRLAVACQVDPVIRARLVRKSIQFGVANGEIIVSLRKFIIE